ncbi:MAG: DUF58 domain-containing protein [Verrucomicrobiales bacterium]|nr:DUF58 domain-containing protein [Verrucomicrobiales bacterium]
MNETVLTDPAFIRRLESLYLLARKVLGGSLQADRKTTKKGSGITFADYAEYNPGDDYRSIDWRIYAKFESLIIKLFELEEDATIYILFDESPSMASKSLYAKQLAAALGYIALNSLDRLCVYGLADRLNPMLEPCRGRGKVIEFLRSLEAAESFGKDTDFTACAREFQARRKRKGVVIVISDFLFPQGFEEGLKYLQYHRHDVFCVQVQDDNDRSCTWKGDVNLECVETGKNQRVTISPAEARAYEQAVAVWNEDLRKACARHSIGLASTTPDVAFEVVIQEILRRGGLVA